MTKNKNKTYQTKELTPEQIEKKKQYYRDYYLRRKKEKGITTTDRRGRRPHPPPPPLKVYAKGEPYILYYD